MDNLKRKKNEILYEINLICTFIVTRRYEHHQFINACTLKVLFTKGFKILYILNLYNWI